MADELETSASKLDSGPHPGIAAASLSPAAQATQANEDLVRNSDDISPQRFRSSTAADSGSLSEASSPTKRTMADATPGIRIEDIASRGLMHDQASGRASASTLTEGPERPVPWVHRDQFNPQMLPWSEDLPPAIASNGIQWKADTEVSDVAVAMGSSFGDAVAMGTSFGDDHRRSHVSSEAVRAAGDVHRNPNQAYVVNAGNPIRHLMPHRGSPIRSELVHASGRQNPLSSQAVCTTALGGLSPPASIRSEALSYTGNPRSTAAEYLARQGGARSGRLLQQREYGNAAPPLEPLGSDQSAYQSVEAMSGGMAGNVAQQFSRVNGPLVHQHSDGHPGQHYMNSDAAGARFHPRGWDDATGEDELDAARQFGGDWVGGVPGGTSCLSAESPPAFYSKGPAADADTETQDQASPIAQTSFADVHSPTDQTPAEGSSGRFRVSTSRRKSKLAWAPVNIHASACLHGGSVGPPPSLSHGDSTTTLPTRAADSCFYNAEGEIQPCDRQQDHYPQGRRQDQSPVDSNRSAAATNASTAATPTAVTPIPGEDNWNNGDGVFGGQDYSSMGPAVKRALENLWSTFQQGREEAYNGPSGADGILFSMLEQTKKLQSQCRMERVYGVHGQPLQRAPSVVPPAYVSPPPLPLLTRRSLPQKDEQANFRSLISARSEHRGRVDEYRAHLERALKEVLEAKESLKTDNSDRGRSTVHASRDLHFARMGVRRDIGDAVAAASELQEMGEDAASAVARAGSRIAASRSALIASQEGEAWQHASAIQHGDLEPYRNPVEVALESFGHVQLAVWAFAASLLPLLPALEAIPKEERSPSESIALQVLRVVR